MQFQLHHQSFQPTPVFLPGESHGQRRLVGYSPQVAKSRTRLSDFTFTFTISPASEHPGLISFRMDWLDLLAVQGTLKSLPQHHSSKVSILLHSAFFIVQLSHPYMTTGKTIALIRQTYVGKVMSLLFNMLSRLVVTFLPRSKNLNFLAAITICSDFGSPQK